MSLNLIFETSVTEGFKTKLSKMLPSTETVITKFEIKGNSFSAELRAALFDKASALEWKEEFEQKSGTSYRCDSGYPDGNLKTIFRRSYQCIHNTKSSSTNPTQKHSGCNAKLTINVKNSKMKKNKDVYLREHPCQIFVKFDHNHELLEPLKEVIVLDKTEVDLHEYWLKNVMFTNTIQSSPSESSRTDENGQDLENYKNVNGEEVQLKVQELKECFEVLEKKLSRNPTIFYGAFEQFVAQFRTIKTDSHMVAALQTFGKNHESDNKQTSKRKRTKTENKKSSLRQSKRVRAASKSNKGK